MSGYVIPSDIHHAGVAMVAAVGEDDASCWVEFYTRSVHHAWQSQQQGRPIFVNVDYVKIRRPGERDVMDREVREEDQYRWPRQWQQYQNQQQQRPDGMPLTLLYPTDPALVDMFAKLAIHTVEQLANLTEAAIQRLGMGGREHVERAKRFVAASQGTAAARAVEAQLEAANDKIAELENAIRQMQEQMAEKPKRGRRADMED